ncbi:MAG: ABC transporter permease [Planctomycetes bacterium]|nr:ABC transporter permease [Planctomycetota bacterium]
MRAINKKMFRDLWHMRGQALAILLIISSGVALLVTMLSVVASLQMVRDEYYAEYRLADVFANCKRAPDGVAERIREIDGVDVVETRVVVGVTLDLPGVEQPAVGQIVSIPDGEQPRLNSLYLHEGRLPQEGSEGEVVAMHNFAKANAFELGDKIDAIINGRLKALTIVGIGLSPEYVYAIQPGGLYPDDRLYGVMWMNETDLSAAYDMDGAFNDVVLTLQPGASEGDVIRQLDMILEPYGGRGAIPRADQQSYWFLETELSGLEEMGPMIAVIFLGVAAFLLNVVVSRLVKTQREQIAALKAFGYSNTDIAIHFGQLVGIIVLAGGVAGTAAGWGLGSMMIPLYAEYFQFPELRFYMPPWVPVAGVLTTAIAVGIGTLSAVGRAASLPPAEAMRPETPPTFRKTLIERIGLQRFLAQPTRMILRNLERRPFQAALSVLGISFGVALMFLMYAMFGVMDYVVDLQQNVMHREDVEVTFHEPRSRDALHEVESLPGVLYAEPFRSVGVRLRFRHRDRILAIRGIPDDSKLERVLDQDLQPITVPDDGILISKALAESMHLAAGDMVTLEALEGARPVREVKVSGLVDDFFGVSAFMELGALNRLMRDGDVLNSVKLTIGSDAETALFEELRARPGVASAATKGNMIEAMEEQIDEYLLVMIGMGMFFAGIIAFGVVYNTARISVSERSRELASLRVLGLTRGEISYILLGELAILTVLALPVGFLIGYGLLFLFMDSVNSEVMRFPVMVDRMSFALSATAVIAAAMASGLVVRRKLDNLDLVEVLKTRE